MNDIKNIALINTDILIADMEDGAESPNLTGFDDLKVSSVSYSELMIGVGMTTDIDVYRERDRRVKKIQSVIGDGVPFTDDCASEMDQIVRDLIKSEGGSGMKTADYMIAATAIANGFTLLTRNEKTFRGIRGLKVEQR